MEAYLIINIGLIYYKFIESLPTIIGDLKHLTKLLLQECENLKEVPQTIGKISSLSILDLSYYKSIESIPTTIGDLKHLIGLMLVGFVNLKEFL